MTTTAARLITLILLLQRQPGQKARDLAAELGISVRSLHRYFAMLDEMGIPIYAERGPAGGFSLVRGYKMPPLVFSPEEAVAVCLGTSLVSEMWGQLYLDAARSALAKLDNLLPDEQRDEVTWARRALVTTGLHHPSLDAQAALLERLRRAIRGSRRVSMVYHSASGPEAGARQLDPYALVLRAGWWYVIGYCHTRREVRTFRVDRIQDLTLQAEVFPVPTDFEAREFAARDFQGQQSVRVRFRYAPEAAHLARINRASWEALEEQPDGAVVVTASAPDLNWAASSALAYGPALEVLDPPELRRLVRDWVQAIAAMYPSEEAPDG